jgi:hypothetical protein
MNKRNRRLLLGLSACLTCLLPCESASAVPVTVSPLQGTLTAMPQSQISFLGAAAGNLSSISVVGSKSGRHAGRLRSYTSIRGASFVPSKPFTPGEHVSVHALWSPPKRSRSTLTTAFTVAQPATPPLNDFVAVAGKPSDVQSFVSRPELHPPVVTVHQAASSASAPGDLLAAPFLGPGQWGPMIFDNAGNLVWFDPLPPGSDAAGLRTQLYRGKNDLTWWQGRTVTYGYGLGVDVVADANYRTVAVVKAGNGLQADEHEFLLTSHGSAYVLAYSPIQTSLASVGGPASGTVIEGVIQQIDIHTGLVMWEWHSSDHVSLSDSYSKPPTSPTGVFDYFHVNSLTTDPHGNLLISARNTWTLYDISPHSGALIWRLGGKASTFAMGPGVQFAYQHNAMWMANGDISLFDDEGFPPIKPPSRAEIVRLDQKAKTATLVQQFVRTAPLSTGSQGNAQSLPGGGWMVGWGGLPNVTEFDALGNVIYDAQLPTGENSYRVYREPWAGQPTELPTVVAKAIPGTPAPGANVYASWNGATTVFSWQLLSGPDAAHLTAISTTARSGFETTIPAPVAAFYAVRALSASGKVLATSMVVKTT